MKHDSSTFNLISIGQLSKRKNHEIVIRSIARMNNSLINYKIIGIGELESYLKNLVEELGLQNQVSFLGFQENVAKYLSESDCFVFPSLQEGLPVSLMEAMAIPLPVICSKIRGNTDLIENMRGGILVDPSDEEEYIKAIMMLFENRRLCYEYSKFNLWKIKEFDKNVVNKKMVNLYEDLLV
ncbi:glycosyltransferase [Enterococcus sp.]